MKFFRQIRQRLLTDNKFSKYLFYAIGEILLVVIGILIALQVDNWNEQRVEKIELEGFLSSISKNIQQDIIEIKTVIQRRNQAIAYADQILTAIHEDKLQSVPDSVILNGFLYSFVEQYTQFNESGLDALKNSAYLGKLNNTLYEEKLFAYYNLVGIIKDREKSLNEFIEAMEVDASKDGKTNAHVKYRYYPGSTNGDALREMLKEPSILSVFYRMIGIKRLMNTYYPELIAKGHAFVYLIDP